MLIHELNHSLNPLLTQPIEINQYKEEKRIKHTNLNDTYPLAQSSMISSSNDGYKYTNDWLIQLHFRLKPQRKTSASSIYAMHPIWNDPLMILPIKLIAKWCTQNEIESQLTSFTIYSHQLTKKFYRLHTIRFGLNLIWMACCVAFHLNQISTMISIDVQIRTATQWKEYLFNFNTNIHSYVHIYLLKCACCRRRRRSILNVKKKQLQLHAYRIH